jgi:hypothetical protein
MFKRVHHYQQRTLKIKVRGCLVIPGETASETIGSLARRKSFPIPVLHREGRQRSERAQS